jgi:hypothetical protein
MRKSVVFLVGVGMDVCLASCASPDRAGYRIAADHHTKSAQIARDGVAADEAAAQSFAEQGDQSAASHAEESANQFRRAYRSEQFQANKDRWLSQWWPSLSLQ